MTTTCRVSDQSDHLFLQHMHYVYKLTKENVNKCLSYCLKNQKVSRSCKKGQKQILIRVFIIRDRGITNFLNSRDFAKRVL